MKSTAKYLIKPGEGGRGKNGMALASNQKCAMGGEKEASGKRQVRSN